MKRDQRLLEEAYCKIYESLNSFHDDRLTEKEERFVDQAVDAMIDNYPRSLTNYLDIYKEISQSIFLESSRWLGYISMIRGIMGNEHSNFNQMSKAGLIDILNDEKEKQKLKDNFKLQVAQNIAKRFENPVPHDYVVFGPAYFEQRAKEVRDKRIQKNVSKELSSDLDVNLDDFS